MKLQDVMEYLDSKGNLTMDMVLTRISKSLTDVSFLLLFAFFSSSVCVYVCVCVFYTFKQKFVEKNLIIIQQAQYRYTNIHVK